MLSEEEKTSIKIISRLGENIKKQHALHSNIMPNQREEVLIIK